AHYIELWDDILKEEKPPLSWEPKQYRFIFDKGFADKSHNLVFHPDVDITIIY
ncbi:hypothetical protein KI387_015840, partial [Taxus chinensis]